jgi:hypothetical protein
MNWMHAWRVLNHKNPYFWQKLKRMNTMKRMVLLMSLAVLALSCNQSVKEKSAEGDTVNREEIITATVEELLLSPADYQDREIAISGMVTHVCREGGQKCFILAADGETQLRIVTGEGIDEFKIDMEGSTVSFKGIFRVLNAAESEAQMEDYDTHESHVVEQAHSGAEKADYFVEALDFKEVSL